MIVVRAGGYHQKTCYMPLHHNLRLLRSLTVSDLSKSAFHPEMKREMTIAELVERMGRHGAAHLRQIEELKVAANNK